MPANGCFSSPEYYNSSVTLNRDGETVAHYRKTFLYPTDETWALEGPYGFYGGDINGLGSVAMGISKAFVNCPNLSCANENIGSDLK